jgi:MFS family permease
MADTYIAIPSCVMISCVMMFFGAKLSGIIKHRGCAALGCGLICAALFLMSVITNWVVFLAVFIGFCGSAVGIGYIPALHCGWAYHPWIKGRITGTILTFFGFGAFIFSLIGTWIVNPDNKEATIVEQYGKTTYRYFTADVYENVPTMYIAFFFIYLGIACIAVILLKYPDDTEKLDIK